MTTPNLQLSEMPSNSLQPSAPFNASMQALDALVQLTVETITATPPTTTSADVGKRWIVGTGATGVWVGKDNQVALCTAANTWTYYTPQEGWRADVKDEDLQYRYSGSDWSTAQAAAAPYDLIVAVSDETTNLTTGTAKVTFRAPRAINITKIKASLATASSSGNVQFDVNKNGVSLFSTALTIDANEKTSETATTAAVLASTSIAADDEITIDVDVAGTGAKGAKIAFVGTSA